MRFFHALDVNRDPLFWKNHGVVEGVKTLQGAQYAPGSALAPTIQTSHVMSSQFRCAEVDV
jgi:hypothetical protein